MRADFHAHSDVSIDCTEPMVASVQAAIDRGLTGICFTDHCDLIYNDNPQGGKNEKSYIDWQKSYAEIEAVRARFAGQIEILHGMELAEIAQDPEGAKVAAAAPGLDFILGSVHVLPGEQDFYYLKFPNLETCTDLVDRYLDENIRIARHNLADVMAHIGYHNRYMKRQGLYVELMNYEDKLRTLFDILIQNGRGIELNTSGLRQTVGESFPNLPVLKLYRKCGGEIVTIGSDAHRAADVGSHYDEACDLLREAGFRYTTIFRQRKPEMIPF